MTLLAELIILAEAFPVGDDSWRGQCPSCGSARGLIFRERRDGTRIDLRCIRGCPQAELEKGLGLIPADLNLALQGGR